MDQGVRGSNPAAVAYLILSRFFLGGPANRCLGKSSGSVWREIRKNGDDIDEKKNGFICIVLSLLNSKMLVIR